MMLCFVVSSCFPLAIMASWIIVETGMVYIFRGVLGVGFEKIVVTVQFNSKCARPQTAKLTIRAARQMFPIFGATSVRARIGLGGPADGTIWMIAPFFVSSL